MDTRMNAVKQSVGSALGYLMGPGLVPQLLLTIVIMITVYSVIAIIETIVEAIKKYTQKSVTLLRDTYTSAQYISQDPLGPYPYLYPSENEVNGMEFSYSMHLFISPDSFMTSETDQCGDQNNTGNMPPSVLRHVMSKGNKNGWPIMGPAVFLHGDKNTLRVYMNSVSSVNNYVDIPNIPVGKWFHMVIMFKGKNLDVYINGNVVVRHTFGEVPKLNFGPVRVLTDIKFPSPSFTGYIGNIRIDGAMKGMISRLKYFAFSLNYSQIDTLYREQASKVIVSNSFDKEQPPYLHDSWWVTRY